MSVTIVNPSPALVWDGTLTARTSTTHLIVHHAAGLGTVHDIHQDHLEKGYIGIGYNFYIRQDGTIYNGRGWDMVGAHTLEGYNDYSIGICNEGDYDSSSAIPVVQQRACIALMAEALALYPTITTIGGHNDFRPTACPGQYFPKANVIASAQAYSNVSAAASTLTTKGVISSPNYWIDNFFRVQYLSNLLISCAAYCKSYVTYNATTVPAATARLTAQGIISSPDYWNAVYTSLDYLGTLLINAANRS